MLQIFWQVVIVGRIGRKPCISIIYKVLILRSLFRGGKEKAWLLIRGQKDSSKGSAGEVVLWCSSSNIFFSPWFLDISFSKMIHSRNHFEAVQITPLPTEVNYFEEKWPTVSVFFGNLHGLFASFCVILKEIVARENMSSLLAAIPFCFNPTFLFPPLK